MNEPEERPIDHEKQERIAKIIERVTLAGLLAMRQPKADTSDEKDI